MNVTYNEKLSRTKLSNAYKIIKAELPEIKWLDILRKTTRKSVFDSYQTSIQKKEFQKMKEMKDKRDAQTQKIKKQHQQILEMELEMESKNKTKKSKNVYGKLGNLISKIKNLKPSGKQYLVATVEFYNGPVKHFTITPNNQMKIIDELINLSMGKMITTGNGFSDDMAKMLPGKKIKSFTIEDKVDFIKKEKTNYAKNMFKKYNKKRQGGFFPFTHKIDNEFVEDKLKQLQIYKTGFIPENPDVCFIEAIKGQIPHDIVQKIKHDIRNEYVPFTTIKKVCEANNIFVKIRIEKQNRKIIKIGDKDAMMKADICCINDHYFKFIENMGVTSYFIKNYDELKDKADGYTFYKKNARTKDRFINSYNLVDELLKHKDNLLEEVSYDVIKQFKSVQIDTEKLYDFDVSKCCQPIDNSPKKLDEKSLRVYFDCETYTDKFSKHIPYLVSCMVGDETKSFIGKNCFNDFLDYLAERYGSSGFKSAPELEMYAHNSTYDGSFLMRKLMNLQILEKDNRYVSLKGVYCSWNKSKKFVKVLVKDSYRLIPMKLAEIPEACGFDDTAVKEVMYYNMYNHKTIDSITKMKKKDMMTYIDEFNKQSHMTKDELKDKQKTFFDNLKTWECINKDKSYDLMKYSRIYCEKDCEVLKLGMKKWHELFKHIDSRINVFDFYSLPSLADYYFRINDCYEGCYQLNGSLGSFFQNFVSGGRVCQRNNEKQREEKHIQDFDAVSLYPSAMHLFPGFLKGTPKRITSKRYEDIKDYDGYFVKVKITKVGKDRPIPVLNYDDKENGTKNWSNDLVGKFCFLDKTGLEDAIKFQNVEFDVIDGYYFDEGFNEKIKEQILIIFNKRLEAKKDGNDALQKAIKLLMNSSYGKLIQKTPDSDIRYKKKEDVLSHVEKYYNHIKCWTDISNSKYVRMETFKALDESFSSPHLGTQILSYSKRLMNQVICLADDKNIKIYYTDTDSIHIDEDGVKPLAKAFKEKYGRELIGKSLGQFHCDFEWKGMTDVRSVGFISLGKKSYIDKLEGKDKKKKKQYTYHIRLKGISPDAVEDACKTQNITEWELYEKLYKGDAVTFNLAVNNKCRFEKSKDQEYSTYCEEFKRTVQFVTRDEIIANVYSVKSSDDSIKTIFKAAKKKDKRIRMKDVRSWFDKNVE